MNSTSDTNQTTARSRWGTPNTAGVSIPHELTFDGVGRQINGVDILQDITFGAKSGTVTCLLGPSGSGKTTLLRIAAGMERNTAGTVSLDTEVISAVNRFLPPEKRGIGLVFQDYALFPHLNLLENVMFGLAGLKADARKVQAHRMLTRVGLNERCTDYPHQLSGGEQQRVALARALAPRPGVLLMDEPFSGLDARLRDTMREETLSMLRETRATSVIVTHDPEEALRMGDQIVLLHNGHLAQTGTGRDLYYHPKTLFAAAFFSELNTFSARVLAGQAQTPLGPIPANDLADGEAVTVAVRVNAIEVRPDENLTDGGKKQRPVIGRVVSSQFSGDQEYLQVGIVGSDHVVRARQPAGSLPGGWLDGSRDVVLVPSLDGSFVYSASGDMLK